MLLKLKRPAPEVEALLRGEVRRLDFPFGRFLAALDPGQPAVRDLQAHEAVAWARPTAGKPLLAALDAAPGGTAVDLGPCCRIGGDALALIGGPCSVEDREQIVLTARTIAAYGGTALRGGAFKPRTSPYAFQGLGLEGARLLREAGDAAGLPVITEVMDPADVEPLLPYVDCFQIGARNMSSAPLLRAVGRAGKPVLLKRGPASTLEEFVLAAEYVLLEGNPQVILCERGIRTFETATRNTLDLNAVPVLKGMTHLPVVVDPSHGTGRRDAVLPMARAAVAAGADGILVEVHPDPARALSDGPQSLHFPEFRRLAEALAPIAKAVGRRFDLPGSQAGVPLIRRAVGWGTAP